MSISSSFPVVWRKVWVAIRSAISRESGILLERHLRGKEDFRMLQQSDVAVVSFGKSGRTWLRVLLSHFYQQRYKLPEGRLITHDNFHLLDPRVPSIFFTHDNYLGDFTGSRDSKEPYRNNKVVLLVRHPGDTAVSQFFQWKHRMRPRKKAINAYPDAEGELPIIDFVMGDEAGLPKIARFMNGWATAMGSLQNMLVVRYETLREDTAGTLGKILAFMGEKPSQEELDAAVAFASIENMRAMEQDRFYKQSGSRMKPGDASNPDSFKVRRAKVGGYKDYFTDEEVARIEAAVEKSFDPAFGYGSKPAAEKVL